MRESALVQKFPTHTPQTDAPEEELSWADALEELERQKQLIQEQAKAPAPSAAAASAPMPSLRPVAELPNLQFILDIPLQVTVKLGRKRLLVNDLLQLSQGSVIEL